MNLDEFELIWICVDRNEFEGLRGVELIWVDMMLNEFEVAWIWSRMGLNEFE